MKPDYGTSKIHGMVAAFLVFLPVLFFITLLSRDTLSYIVQSAGGSFDLQVVLGKAGHRQIDCRTATDKLLGGLLASGFNESSCYSRQQSTFYRKPSPHKPSAYLIQKLRKYEELHAKCGPNTDLYKKALEKLKFGIKDGSEECNYLIWVPVSGMGNRILTLTSAFLHALLTKRVLLIDRGMEMAQLFCEPFPDSSWLLPSDFPSIPNGRNENSFGFMLRNKSLNGPDYPKFAYLHLAHDYNYFDKLFFCEEDQLLLNKIPWLRLRSDVYFAPLMFLIPSFEEELSKLFPEREMVFHHLGRYLFHPSNAVWKFILRYYNAYLASADEKVGIQVRVFAKGPGPHQHVLQQILSCSRSQSLLPELATQEENARKKSVESPKRKALLFTSLSSWYSDEIRNMYWELPTVSGEVVSVFQPSHEEQQSTGRPLHDMKAWAEVYLLSLCDVLITSSQSTFGYVAQGLGGIRPWILAKPENQTVPNPPCRRAMSMEPCFHSPPSYDCKTKKNADLGALVPFLKHCEDVPLGIKLLDVDSA